MRNVFNKHKKTMKIIDKIIKAKLEDNYHCKLFYSLNHDYLATKFYLPHFYVVLIDFLKNCYLCS